MDLGGTKAKPWSSLEEDVEGLDGVGAVGEASAIMRELTREASAITWDFRQGCGNWLQMDMIDGLFACLLSAKVSVL